MPSIMRDINIISRCAAAYRGDRLEGTELAAMHHAYVLSICRHPGISQEALSRHICISKSNVTRALAYLEEHGFVERRQSETDKRVTLVYPTEKMQEHLPHVRAIASDWNAFLTENLTEQEVVAFRETLTKLSARAESYLDGKEPSKA